MKISKFEIGDRVTCSGHEGIYEVVGIYEKADPINYNLSNYEGAYYSSLTEISEYCLTLYVEKEEKRWDNTFIAGDKVIILDNKAAGPQKIISVVIGPKDYSYRLSGIEGIIHESNLELHKPVKGQMKRDNKDKLDWSQIPFKLLNGQVRTLMFGAKKYGRRNWETGAPISEIYNSLQRHINSFMEGEDNDKESGLSHLGHAQANLMFLVHVMDNRKEFDDRSKEGLAPKGGILCYDDNGQPYYIKSGTINKEYLKQDFDCKYVDPKDKCSTQCRYCLPKSFNENLNK